MHEAWSNLIFLWASAVATASMTQPADATHIVRFYLNFPSIFKAKKQVLVLQDARIKPKLSRTEDNGAICISTSPPLLLEHEETFSSVPKVNSLSTTKSKEDKITIIFMKYYILAFSEAP